jgi:hypothetical protein
LSVNKAFCLRRPLPRCFQHSGVAGGYRCSQRHAAAKIDPRGVCPPDAKPPGGPAFEGLDREIDALISAAWEGYSRSSKAPRTVKAGPDFADPDYELAIDWMHARDAINAAQQRHDGISQQKRVLLINGSSRSDQTCPGEMSKTYRLCKIAEPILIDHGYAVDFLDLSHLTSETGRQIYPCKSCVSTAMPPCRWPCSCYPNYSLQRTDDWMNEIYRSGSVRTGS